MTNSLWAGEDRTASGCCAEFIAGLSGGELRRLRTSVAHDGALVTPDATTVHGREEVGRVLPSLAAARPQITVQKSTIFEARRSGRATVPGG
jgi:hypothetical protein